MIPLAKNIKRFFTEKNMFLPAFALAVSATILLSLTLSQKYVMINDNGMTIEQKTYTRTVSELLMQNEISVAPYDYISVPLDTKLKTNTVNAIDIKRAVPVTIIADGNKTILMTVKDTVGEMLAESPIKPSGLDELVGVTADDKITKDMTVTIVRVEEEIFTEKVIIPYSTERIADSTMNSGRETVIQEGVEGATQKEYRKISRDGVWFSLEKIKEVVLASPVTAIVKYGTVLNRLSARGDEIRYTEVMDMRATAYTASFKDTGKSPGHPEFGITRTGILAKKGVIAVDPRVIPLGTRVYVEIAGSTPDYGFAIAADTGGAIKGTLIDLYYDTQEYVDRFGVKKVKVYILHDQ